MSATYDIIILNGLVVTDTDVGELDVAIKDEKIVRVVPRGGLKDVEANKTIDAEGGYVMVGFRCSYIWTATDRVQPGGVDAHVHLDEPPLFGKGSTADNYETGI
jgi:dihydropyrimidinase